MIGPTNSAEINISFEVLSTIKDITCSADALRTLSNGSLNVLLNYSYSETSDCFFMLLHNRHSIEIGKVFRDELTPLDAKQFIDLYNDYFENFIDTENIDIATPDFIKFSNTWNELYSLFIHPIFDYIDETIFTRIFCSLSIEINSTRYFIDISSVYDLKYRFDPHAKFDEVFFTNISTENMFHYVTNITNLSFPTLPKIHVLYGFCKHDSKEILDKCLTQSEVDAAIIREKLFSKTISDIKSKGGKVTFLEDITSLENAFSKQNEGYFIQILAHFHDGRLFTRNRDYVRFNNIERMLFKMIKNGTCSSDIAIDAMTCTNFNGFKSLYDLKVKYLIFSHHDISTDLAAIMFHELYNGENAKLLKVESEYLDGKIYMHEAWSKVMRVFYKMMSANRYISLPKLNYQSDAN